jgi:hypothetical protein
VLNQEHKEAFAELIPVLEKFAAKNEMEMEYTSDDDPFSPDGACFLSWKVKSSIQRNDWVAFIKVRLRDPLSPDGNFFVSVLGRNEQIWNYTIADGLDRLNQLLDQAKAVGEGAR